MNIQYYLLAARPRTLLASISPILLVAGELLSRGFYFSWERLIVLMLSAGAIQVGTNFVNDAADASTGADNPATRLGTPRAASLGLLTPEQVWRAAHICFFAAFLAGIPLIVWGGWPILALGICSIISGYAYTSGPFPLAYHGLGDVFVFLFFGAAATFGSAAVLVPDFEYWGLWVPCLQSGAFATAILVVNHLRDEQADRVVQKNTLVVRFGSLFGRIQLFLCFLLIIFLDRWSHSEGLRPTWIILPVVGAVLHLVRKPASKEYNKGLAMTAMAQFLFSLVRLLEAL